MGALLSLFTKKEERKPASFVQGLTNGLSNNWRGLLSCLLVIIIMAALVDPSQQGKTVTAIWLSIFVFMLISPVTVGAASLVPVFAMPMLGILSSVACCGSLINENIILFFVGGWLLFLTNNCGLDKRIACFFLASGDKDSFTPQKILLKSCMAAFFTSALGERELSTQAIMKYIMSAFEPLQIVKNEADYPEIRKIVCNALAISSSIGSLCIMHASLTTLQMRSLFCDASEKSLEFPDVFNFLNYSAYAVPTAIVMFIVNTGFQVFLITQKSGKKPISPYSKEVLQKAFVKQQKDLGPMSSHEKVKYWYGNQTNVVRWSGQLSDMYRLECGVRQGGLSSPLLFNLYMNGLIAELSSAGVGCSMAVSAFFIIVILICYFTRWSKWLGMGWGTFRQYQISPEICGVKDGTTACIFAVILHFLPKTFDFLKIFSVSKQRDMPRMKVESGILFWKFVDKQTDYSLFILLGTGTILYKAMVVSNLHEDIANLCGNAITGMDWNVGILIVVIVSVIGGTFMSGLAAQAILMPFMLGMAMTGQNKWPQRQYLVALAVGIGTGLGFCFPFYHSPSAFVRSIGKVESKKQVMYSIASSVICGLILWVTLCFYAPILWDPNDVGIIPQLRPGQKVITTTTEAAGEAGPPAPAVI